MIPFNSDDFDGMRREFEGLTLNNVDLDNKNVMEYKALGIRLKMIKLSFLLSKAVFFKDHIKVKKISEDAISLVDDLIGTHNNNYSVAGILQLILI